MDNIYTIENKPLQMIWELIPHPDTYTIENKSLQMISELIPHPDTGICLTPHGVCQKL